MPSIVAASVWQIPHASTRIRTCPAPGSATGRSTTRSFPGTETSTALYVLFICVCLSILFSSHPFANIRSAVFKPHTIRFAAHKKTHCLSIDNDDVFQFQNDLSVVRLPFKESPQLGDRLFFDSAAQDEYGESSSRRSLNSEGHRLGPFDRHRSHSRSNCVP